MSLSVRRTSLKHLTVYLAGLTLMALSAVIGKTHAGNPLVPASFQGPSHALMAFCVELGSMVGFLLMIASITVINALADKAPKDRQVRTQLVLTLGVIIVIAFAVLTALPATLVLQAIPHWFLWDMCAFGSGGVLLCLLLLRRLKKAIALERFPLARIT